MADPEGKYKIYMISVTGAHVIEDASLENNYYVDVTPEEQEEIKKWATHFRMSTDAVVRKLLAHSLKEKKLM